ncbi:MAG: hypothetical protein ACI89X_001497 [Planctomycetota bacterium]|jgi:hypothetical protein
MSFTAPWGLLALLSVPVIIALHLFRNRLPEKRVAAVFLFPGTAVASDGGRTRTKLRGSRSLWLECLAAVLATLWLSGFTFGNLLPRHLVIVIDNSASMAATSTHECAGVVLQHLHDDLAANDEVSIVVSGTPAQVAVGPRARRNELQAFLTQWQPSMPNHSLQSALDLAREVAGHSGEIVFVTDADPADPCSDLRIVACGHAVGNAAVASVQRLRGAVTDRLLVTIVGYGKVADGDVVVTAGEVELARVPMSQMKPSGGLEFAVSVPREQERIHVQLPDDVLAIDNDAWLVSAPDVIVSVCDELSPALRSELELPRIFDAMKKWREEPNAGRAQLILRAVPGRLRVGQIEMVLARTEGEKQAHRSPFVLDRSHPLLSGIELQGIAWQSGSGRLPGQVLVASGDKVLISAEQMHAGRRIWCDVDGKAGNFVRAPDWPILFANVLELARQEVPGCVAQQLAVGDELIYRSGELKQSVELVGPTQQVLVKSVGDLTGYVTQPGLHQVRTRDGRTLAEVAVRFVDPHESDLRTTKQFDHPADEAVRSSVAARIDAGPMRRILAVLLLLAVGLNWWWLQRRAS